MIEYLSPLKEKFEALANDEKADFLKKYLKNQYEFYGIDAKSFRSAVKEFLASYGFPSPEAAEKMICYLWGLPQREYQQAGIEILRRNIKSQRKEDIRYIEFMIVHKSWWDTVDFIAIHLCGPYFSKYREQIKPVTEKWMDSENMWLQRSSLLFQLKYKQLTDTQLLTEYIERLMHRKEFFIRKAIGWVLREYSKTNREWVRQFVSSHHLSTLSRNEATKYL